MRLAGPRAAALLLGFWLGGCAWAPFDESLLDGDAGTDGVDGPGRGKADDPDDTTHDGEPLDRPSDDAGAPSDPDAGDDDAADVLARRGMLRTSGEVEPNDSMALSQPVGLYYTVLAEWTPAGDDDWYSVDLLAGDALEIRTRADQGACDFDSVLLVYAPGPRPTRSVPSCAQSDPAALACVDDAGGSPCASTTFVAPADDTYFVRVVEQGDDDHALYTIDFELVP